MTISRIPAIALALALLAPPLLAQAPAADSALTVPQFAGEVGKWQALVAPLSGQPAAAASLKDTVPAQWVVERDGQRFVVSTRWLSDDLGRIARRRDPAKALADASQRLAALHREAEAAGAPAVSFAAERARAGEILSRREFAGVGPPGWLDRLEQRIASWIDNLLLRAVGHAFGHPMIGNALVWILIAAALVVIALFTYRRLTRQAGEEEVREREEERRPLTWLAWVEQASAAAARGDFREALRAAYWAAIHRLEAAGAWRPDPARTPREYLRVLPPDSVRRAPLLAITRKFELAWYGRQAATRRDFEESAAELEKLGCPLTSTRAIARS